MSNDDQQMAGSLSPENNTPHSTASPPPVNPSSTASPQQNSSAANGNASQTGPQAPHGLNPRSCVTCRRRKVKCDKKRPCSNCTRAGIDCIFPAPGRAPRKPRKPPDTELLARLRRLEGVVSSLGASVDEHGNATVASGAGLSGVDGATSDPSVIHNMPKDRYRGLSQDSLDSDFGRLVIDEGRSRYVTKGFWANLSNEVEDIKAILNYSSDEEDQPVMTPSESGSGQVMSPSGHGFVFGFRSDAQDLHAFHPSQEHAFLLWELYKEHIDPLIKVLHLPTMHPKVVAAINDPTEHGGRAMEAFLFAIYFSVATSITPEECVAVFGHERSALVKNFRFGIEQALARANFLYSEEMTVLQAFLLFLICLRRHEDARVIWSLSALVVRIAMIMGLHRDGTNFNLPVYDTEIRRRTWWAVCILDIRTAEDHGCDATIIEESTDTKVPLNIDDADFDPTTTEPPPERDGICEMTFCVIRQEVAKVFRRLNTSRGPLAGSGGWTLDATLKDKENWIEETHHYLEHKFLRHCDMSKPLHWIICTVTRLMMAKMWLMVYHPYHRNGQVLPQETRDRLFITSIESIEYSLCTQYEIRTIKWGWLFKTYNQWHALAYLLSELCIRTKGPIVERAWRAVEGSVASMADKVGDKGGRSNLLRPLGKIMGKAKAAREKALAEQGHKQGMPFTQDNNAMTAAIQSALQGTGSPPAVMTSSPQPALGIPQDPQRRTSLGLGDHAMLNSTEDYTDPSSITAMANLPNDPPAFKSPDGRVPVNPYQRGFEWLPGNGGLPMRSPFFLNQPDMTPSQFQGQGGGQPVNPQGDGVDNAFMQQWLMNQGAVDVQGKGMYFQDGLSGQQPLPQGGLQRPPHPMPQQMPQGQMPNQQMMGFPPSQQQQQAMMHNQNQGQGPMATGPDGVKWQDWDNMVRDFELEGGGNQWSRQQGMLGGMGGNWL